MSPQTSITQQCYLFLKRVRPCTVVPSVPLAAPVKFTSNLPHAITDPSDLAKSLRWVVYLTVWTNWDVFFRDPLKCWLKMAATLSPTLWRTTTHSLSDGHVLSYWLSLYSTNTCWRRTHTRLDQSFGESSIFDALEVDIGFSSNWHMILSVIRSLK